MAGKREASRKRPARDRRVVALAASPFHFPDAREIPRVMLGAIEWGRRRGWDLVDLGQWGMQVPVHLRVEGLLMHLDGPHEAVARRLAKTVPMAVAMDATVRGVSVPCIRVDRREIGLRAADYLLERGFRTATIASCRRTHLDQHLRSFRDRIREAGGTCRQITAPSDDQLADLGAAADSFRRQIDPLPLPVAIFCNNDRLGARVCRWCLEVGLDVPEQVAVLGVSNDAMSCACSPVPLSSVDGNGEQRGIVAAQVLERMMDGEPPPTEPVLVAPGEVVTRRSTDILAIEDRAAARALRYLWDHYREDLGVDAIAAACAIPRRSLERHFRKSLGRSVNQELVRRRLHQACVLLGTTNKPIIEIAAETGFHSAQYFHVRFTRAHGLTPGAYRLRELAKVK